MKKGYFYFSNQLFCFFKKRYILIASALLLLMLTGGFTGFGQILWSNAIGQAWLTGTNWTGGAVPNTTDIAQFATNPTSPLNSVGIDMSNPTNNGSNNQAIGAIEVTAARTEGLIIGNSSTTDNGILTLNGTTVNTVPNVILRNISSELLTIQNFQGINLSSTMTIALNNITDNIVSIDGTGGITMSSVISGAGRNLSLNGTGNGTLALTAANSYTGLTTVSANTLQLNKTGGGTLPATSNILINGTGTLRISSNQTISNLTMSAGTLLVDAGSTLTITGTYTVTGGTINNPGTIKLNGAAVSFPGTGVIINNGTAGTMSNLEIASSAPVTQTAPFFISGTLTLTTGILTSGAVNFITFNNGANVTGASNASFINGPVSKIGNSTFAFPVGKPNCGPSGTVTGFAALTISSFMPFPGSITDQFTAEYIRDSATALGALSALGVDHISRCDYWTLTRDPGTTSTVDITLSWNDTINNCVSTAPYVNNRPTLTVVHNNNIPLSTWDASGVAGLTSGSNFEGNVTWGSPQSTTFGAFVIGSIDFNNPLPISINYFTGIKQNSGHLLNWKITCNSSPFATIEMERSTDNRNYKSIYSIYATALRCQQPFDHTDSNPAAGINYYRLKMTDANGKITYSTVVSLLNAAKGIDILNIAPNPIVSGSFDLKISAAQNAPIDIIITDMQGRVMQKKAVSMVAGFNSIPVNVARLTAGTYQLYGNTADGRSRVLRFVVQ